MNMNPFKPQSSELTVGGEGTSCFFEGNMVNIDGKLWKIVEVLDEHRLRVERARSRLWVFLWKLVLVLAVCVIAGFIAIVAGDFRDECDTLICFYFATGFKYAQAMFAGWLVSKVWTL